MKCDVIIPVGPGHEESHLEAVNSVKIAAMNKGVLETISIRVVDDTKGELGRSKARNLGVKESEADWIFFLDADDVMHPYAFQALSRNPYIEALWGNIWEMGNGVAAWRYQIPKIKSYQELISFPPYYTLQMGHFVKRDVALKHPFDEDMNCGEDFKYYLEVWKDHICLKVDECLFLNRKGNHSTGPRSATGRYWNKVVNSLLEEARNEAKNEVRNPDKKQTEKLSTPLSTSRCGPGSSKEMTESIRAFLWKVIKDYQITSIVDVGCGDLYWYTLEDYRLPYIGYDDNIREEAKERIKEWMQLRNADVTKSSLEYGDLVICKDVFRHHNDTDVENILKNIKGKYLIADYDNIHTSGQTHHIPQKGDVRYAYNGNRVDLRLWLGEPLESVESDETPIKRFGLWKLSK